MVLESVTWGKLGTLVLTITNESAISLHVLQFSGARGKEVLVKAIRKVKGAL